MEHYGPRTRFGQLLHATKYRAGEERFDDYCVRWARSTTDNDKDFRRALRYTRDQSLLPAGRQQHSMGRPLLTTAYNCLGRDTQVLTREHGVVAIGELDGLKATVLDGNATWQTVEFGSFGVQDLYAVELTNGPKRLSILATSDHGWIINGTRKETTRLSRNSRIDFIGRSETDESGFEYGQGVVHGFVYGDGTKSEKGFHVRICGESKWRAVSQFFEGYPYSRPPSCEGDYVCYFYGTNIFNDLKKLPDTQSVSDEYLLGFMRGWFAADGCVSAQPEVMLCAGPEEETWLRRYGPIVGWNVVGSSLLTVETNYGVRNKISRNIRFDTRMLDSVDFLREFHASRFRRPDVLGWRVASVSQEPVTRDQVFCAIVPTTESFVLAGGVLSGNCFVGGLIPDSYEGILEALKLGGMTLRTGGGMGWNFDTLRPEGEPIRGLGPGSFSTGPLSFMKIWDANCETILTAGHRRGAMMATFSVHHPDILKFIAAKRGTGQLKNFNISVTVTDEFMEALDRDGLYQLRFGETRFRAVRATDVWAKIMDSNWDWAEPGVLFIDRINAKNPLSYCETIYSTNPCSEQPLPPNGACLLGSVNVVKCLTPSRIGNVVELTRPDGYGVTVDHRIVDPRSSLYGMDWELLDDLVDTAVRCFDNVPERTVFPLEAQKEEALAKRRMGVGVTGMANAIEVMGHRYGSPGYIEAQDRILQRVALQAYRTSIELAKEKGSFPLFDADRYLEGWFVNNALNDEIRDGIRRHGLRNGLLLSIAPTGTISMVADNISSGIEPPYAVHGKYTIQMPSGKEVFETTDYAYEFFGVECQTAEETTGEQHVDVLCAAQKWVDSSISKTCNVNGQIAGQGPGMPFADFKQLYMRAYLGGAKGCTTFNIHGKLQGVREIAEQPLVEEGAACRIDGTTGLRSCDI